jgi:hypothetical protein
MEIPAKAGASMPVHVIYFCPRCGCQSFQPSTSRIRKDRILRMLGVHPHRCYICKVRFYLFQPSILKTRVSPIETPGGSELEVPRLRPVRRIWRDAKMEP